MDHSALLDRILKTVDAEAYLPLADQVDAAQRDAMAEVQDLLQADVFEVEVARQLARQLHTDGRIDRVMMCSALHVIAAHPKVRDYAEAARMVADQEHAALETGGPNLDANLASVDRHRGVLAFVMGRYEVALDYFARVFERQRSAGNLANIMSALLRLGDEREARELLDQVRATFPDSIVDPLDEMIEVDPDLALLR